MAAQLWSRTPMTRLSVAHSPKSASMEGSIAVTRSFIDFRRSLPPVVPEVHAHWVKAFDALAHQSDLGLLMHQSTPGGNEAERSAATRFLAPRFREFVSPSRVMLTNGTQSAILFLMKRLVGQGGLVLAERLSYSPLRILADVAGVRIQGLDIDENGILPDAFEDACRRAKPKALYCNPTVQNPTTAIMSAQRRRAIAEIARRYGVVIFEDEALGRLHPDAPAPIAEVAPDLTWYVMSTTKCLSHGLRLAYLVAPSREAANQMIRPIEHLSYWHPAPLQAAVVTRWIENGGADEISNAIARECSSREIEAQKILGHLDLGSKAGSMHVWLSLPAHWHCQSFAVEAERRGVLLRSADLFAIDDQPTPNCVRLSLSTPSSVDEVRRGLTILNELIAERPAQ